MVVGQILNKVDKTPISQVNIYFKNSPVAVQSDENGNFLIKTTGNYTSLIFSCVGFKTEQIRLKQGQSVGVQVELTEENTLLQEVFVIPGSNPANELMKRVRLLTRQNDITRQKGFNILSNEQNLVLMTKLNQRGLSKRIFDQLKTGNLSASDSSLVLPIYMAENKYIVSATAKKELSRNIFSSPESGEEIIEKLVGELSSELNFYNNTVTVFGKSMISPLANISYAYYDYYLADSIQVKTGKQYEVHFRTKNAKSLAFNGELWIDSATLALTRIEVELPSKANINFIHNLRIKESYASNPSNRWMPKSEEMTLNMNYELLADSLNRKPEIFVKRSISYNLPDSSTYIPSTFAQSSYTQESLNDKLNDLNNTPLLRSAKWIAGALFTGYMKFGKIDIGKIQQLMRLTEIEGLSLNLPFKTNEELWKNVSLGGSVGYGLKNDLFKYSGIAQFKLPAEKRRIIGLNYTFDYRRIDFNYNNYLYMENPLGSADEDISGTLLGMRTATKMSKRREFTLSFSNDWSDDIESGIYWRYNQLFANGSLPMMHNGVSVSSYLTQQSASVTTRFSSDERAYDDHLQRIYIDNYKPVIYSILEIGKYKVGNITGQYGKIQAKMKHLVNLDFALLNYVAEAGLIIGKVPYPLLETPPGTETAGYGLYQFSMMNFFEYATDKYVSLQSELTFNGLIMNHIPIIKNLNLREICSFKMIYGSLSNVHKTVLDLPEYTNPLSKPYMEVGVGFTNILRIFSLQSVWRLSDLNHPGSNAWGFRGCIRLNF
jgi:hypothetical protein